MSSNKPLIYQTICELVKKHTNIFVYQHNYPDGDCLGSQFGLVKLLQHNFPNKKIHAMGDHENLYPFLAKTNTKLADLTDADFENSLAIVVDGDSVGRVSYGHHLYPKCLFNTKIRIDHHNTRANISYDYEWIDASYTSVCEQLCDLAINLNWKINQLAANFFYLGIYTDSGRMAFDKVSARTFRVLKWLSLNGAQIFWINTQLSRRSENFTRFMGHVWNHCVIQEQFISYFVSQKIIREYNLNVIEANDANLIGNIQDTKIWAFFVELEDKRIRIRMRSNQISVERILMKFGSMGGHRFSTAVSITADKMPQVIEHVIRWIKDENYRNLWAN